MHFETGFELTMSMRTFESKLRYEKYVWGGGK